MLELGRELSEDYRSVYASFREEERCWDFVREAQQRGFEAHALKHDTPRLVAALRELTGLLRSVDARVLCCNGYKADFLGLLAARRLHIPVISVSRGWTGESLRVRVFERLDHFLLQRMDKVVCVSEGQAHKVRRAGVACERITVIHNAVRPERFTRPQPECLAWLRRRFSTPAEKIVGAAGRLSPEKGFDVLIKAAVKVTRNIPTVGFMLFGDGPLRDTLTRQIARHGLEGRFVLAGFQSDLDLYLPHLDLTVLPSFTEGLPNIVLESMAAGVPVVASAVGGTPEVVDDEIDGYLVPAGDVEKTAYRIAELLSDDTLRRRMGDLGRNKVNRCFSFVSQAIAYRHLLTSIASP